MPKRVYEMLFHAGEVVEIRALGISGKNKGWIGYCGGNSVVAGYFDNAKDFAAAALMLDVQKPKGIYFTLNPCLPALLARSVNRLKVCPTVMSNITADPEIKCLRWLPIDIDTQRPTGISASDEELKLAEHTAKAVADWLEKKLGFAAGIRAMSGNGYHLLYRLPDLANDDQQKNKLARMIDAIANKFDTSAIKIDRKVFNPSRIWKVYGTYARKGDSIKGRQHRKAILFGNQPLKLANIPITELD